jgi:aspartyl-tRNA(Asn)/glutamyl-tRNA(Gln) amidotransferase subunit A
VYPYKNIIEKITAVKSGDLSLSENLRSFLNKIEEKKHLNAFNSVFADEALQSAVIIENKIKQGTHGRLAGCVIAIKDVLALKDKLLTCSSDMLKNYTSVYTATAVQKLLDEDAIIIGKTNCDEFAMGSSNENSAFGNVLNPVDESRVPGGSSGGSAAALKAGLCDAAIGTDTGGSVRQPAAFCGVYGLKPTYGRISRFGLTAFASSFDTVGIFSNNIEDAALLLEVMAGRDPLDSTSSTLPSDNYSGSDQVKEISFGLPKEYLQDGIDSDIKEAVLNTVSRLKNNGHKVIEISLPHTKYTIAAYYILTTAEASSNLSRYDGVRYGYRSRKSSSLSDLYINTRTEGFGTEVKRRIMLGTYVLSSGYYDAYYKKAQKVRRLIRQDFINAFKDVDIIITPVTPSTAFKIGEKTDDPVRMYLNDIFTTSANLAGIPGISIPYITNNLPIGIQLLADQFNEKKLLVSGNIIKGKWKMESK